jgi:hypothetical protein
VRRSFLPNRPLCVVDEGGVFSLNKNEENFATLFEDDDDDDDDEEDAKGNKFLNEEVDVEEEAFEFSLDVC